MTKELIALGTFNYIMTRCKEEDSYIIKFPLGIQKGTTFGEELEKSYEVIKQALLKAQEQEKENDEYKRVLKIIKKKRVNVNQLLLCWKVEMYNSRCRKGYELSKEEFELLKRFLCQNE